ncbi:MAG: hypothetical protein KJZ56_12670 [Flavobacteriales bacterium]|nr:hypothetical protein [Flavobacteriales bacterium]
MEEKTKINTSNPEAISYTTEELGFTILGGIKLEGLDRLRVTLKIEVINRKFNLLPQRNFSSEKYRFGFNGMEKDDEVKGAGNSYSFTFRFYDPRLGRFLSPDPLIVYKQKYPWYTPYQFAGNKPIQAIDLEGLQEQIVVHYKDQDGNTTKITKVTYKNVEDYGPLGNGIYTVNMMPDGTFTEEYTPGEDNSIPSFGASNISQDRWTNQGGHLGFETRLNARLIEKTVENALIEMENDERSVRADVRILQSDDPNWRGKFAEVNNANRYTGGWENRSASSPHKSEGAVGSGEIGNTGLELKLYDGAKSRTIPAHIGFVKSGTLSHFGEAFRAIGGANIGVENAQEYKRQSESNP